MVRLQAFCSFSMTELCNNCRIICKFMQQLFQLQFIEKTQTRKEKLMKLCRTFNTLALFGTIICFNLMYVTILMYVLIQVLANQTKVFDGINYSLSPWLSCYETKSYRICIRVSVYLLQTKPVNQKYTLTYFCKWCKKDTDFCVCLLLADYNTYLNSKLQSDRTINTEGIKCNFS